MKKIRLIFTAALLCMLAALLAVSANAAYWDENPFGDVKSDAWYYNAVRFCRENGILAGTSEDLFSPNTKMTRAMLVTALASADGYDSAAYTRPTFSDVPAASWYYTSVCWAKENGIVAGMGTDTFAPDVPVTREQAAAILRGYAIYAGLSDGESSGDIFAFDDADTASAWAKLPLSWAYENGIMSGTSASLISPKAVTNRASFAVMLRRLFALKPQFTVCGNDISLYEIVIPQSAAKDVGEAASNLQSYIKDIAGVTLPVRTDETETRYEILLGKTARTDCDLSALGETQFILAAKNDRLYICGAKDDDGHVEGTYYGVYCFAEKRLGYEFLADDMILSDPDPIINIEDGYTYIDGPKFETRVVYWAKGWNDVYCNDEYYHGYGLPHQMGNWIKGVGDDKNNDNPCLSDKSNVNALIAYLRKVLEKDPTRNALNIVQNDSEGYCTCDACLAAYREDGTRSATIIRTMNAVSEALTPDYPDVEIFTWAYEYSIRPPKVTKPAPNVSIYFNSIIYCPSHAYSDPNCEKNKVFFEYLDEWGRLCNKVYVWDHSTNFYHLLCPFAGLDEMRQNAADFYAHGVKGVFNNAIAEKSGEFGELRAFLFSRLYQKPDMSKDEYDYLTRRYMETYYGAGYKSLIEYLDLIEKLTTERCFGFNTPASGEFDFDEVLENEALIEKLWADAEAGAKDSHQLEHVKRSELSARYLLQCARFDKVTKNGTDAEKEAYYAENDSLYEDILTFDVRWDENCPAPGHFRRTNSPENWT